MKQNNGWRALGKIKHLKMFTTPNILTNLANPTFWCAVLAFNVRIVKWVL
jgi:hypothetical protein